MKPSICSSPNSVSSPKLHLVKSDTPGQRIIKTNILLLNNSEQFVHSLPKEGSTTNTETLTPEISLEHQQQQQQQQQQARNDVIQFRAGLINATELKKLHPKTYKNWDDMKQRCKVDPETGEPAIVLDPAFEKFADFLYIVGPRPEPTWSIDRIDPKGPYSPENVRWASKTTQSRNRTNTIFLTYHGETKPLAEWAELCNVNHNTLRARRNKGWSDEEIIEGVRSTPHNLSSASPSKSRNPFDYTPWPPEHKELLEMHYQKYHWNGEKRLDFMKRHSEHMAEIFSNRAALELTPPEYGPPSVEEEKLSQYLGKAYRFWLHIHQDARKKLAGNYNLMLYGQFQLPEWVQNSLSKYTHYKPGKL